MRDDNDIKAVEALLSAMGRRTEATPLQTLLQRAASPPVSLVDAEIARLWAHGVVPSDIVALLGCDARRVRFLAHRCGWPRHRHGRPTTAERFAALRRAGIDIPEEGSNE